eukprot:TRINITY_DN30354_c0_g1_i3.p2 TRINITY_DN30354_c0_g1~~TRINITY_DN30354_c0_g1_i3.p2  ORF type:complete len:100 (+),score=12.53 TRINITY_DN30354_c0_g1_i3:186-485(+)
MGRHYQFQTHMIEAGRQLIFQERLGVNYHPRDISMQIKEYNIDLSFRSDMHSKLLEHRISIIKRMQEKSERSIEMAQIKARKIEEIKKLQELQMAQVTI